MVIPPIGLQLGMRDSEIFVKSSGKVFLGIKLNIIFTSNLREISIVRDLKSISNIHIDKVLGGIKMTIPSLVINCRCGTQQFL